MNSFDVEALDTFLREAKAATYASGVRAAIAEDGSDNYWYERGDWKYQDHYIGDNEFFIGDEKVWHCGKQIWRMNYDGAPMPGIDMSVTYGFLKAALFSLGKDENPVPVRGPQEFRKDGLLYLSGLKGNSLRRFSGTELVLEGSRVLCQHTYKGGLILSL